MTQSSGGLTDAQIEAIISQIIASAINVDVKYISVNITATQTGYSVDIYSVNYPNDSIPTGTYTYTLVVEALYSPSTQQSILNQTAYNVDSTTLPDNSPNPTPNDKILGLPLYAWIIIGVGAFLIVVFAIIIAIYRAREKERKPWNEFV